jgi:hypothetical protein
MQYKCERAIIKLVYRVIYSVSQNCLLREKKEVNYLNLNAII